MDDDDDDEDDGTNSAASARSTLEISFIIIISFCTSIVIVDVYVSMSRTSLREVLTLMRKHARRFSY